MALLACEVPFEIREVALRDKPEEMIAASPKATVPVLVLTDGKVIDESIGIMRWALQVSDPHGWLKGDDAALIERFDIRFKHHLDRYKYSDPHGAEPFAHRDAALAMLLELDLQVAFRRHLHGDRPTLADIAIMPFVRQFAAVDHAWFAAQPVPHVQAWLDRHIRSPLFERAMVKLKPWARADAPIFW